MYYRYKTKKKDSKIFKTILALTLISVSGYFLYTYRHYLMIWKYNHNKLTQKIEEANNIQDINQRRIALQKLIAPFNSYREENPAKPDAFILNGYVHYLIGASHLQGDFTDIIIKNLTDMITPQAKAEFMHAIKYFKKGETLLHNEPLDPKYALKLAEALFYCKYETSEDIYNRLHTYEDTLTDASKIRFYAFICVLHNKADKGISLLKKSGKVENDAKGKLFFAITEKYAKHYTNAIKILKDILPQTTDKTYLKIAHINLGEIFSNQSLPKEALFHYSTALTIDETDNDLRITLGKVHYAQGDKQSAKAMWEEALKRDKQNSEIEKLLNMVKK